MGSGSGCFRGSGSLVGLVCSLKVIRGGLVNWSIKGEVEKFVI